MSKFKTNSRLLNFLKYFVIIVGGVVCIAFVGDSSFRNLIAMDRHINELRELIRKEQKATADAKRKMELIENDPSYIEHVAREEFYMKRDDEDVYVLRSQAYKPNNETVK